MLLSFQFPGSREVDDNDCDYDDCISAENTIKGRLDWTVYSFVALVLSHIVLLCLYNKIPARILVQLHADSSRLELQLHILWKHLHSEKLPLGWYSCGIL